MPWSFGALLLEEGRSLCHKRVRHHVAPRPGRGAHRWHRHGGSDNSGNYLKANAVARSGLLNLNTWKLD